MLIKFFPLFFIALLSTASATEPVAKSVVGSMPYSNQWKFEVSNSFLYLTYNAEHMNRTQLRANQYSAQFSSAQMAYPSVDYFVRILRLRDLETKSILSNLALWGRYALGFGIKQAKLSTEAYELSSVSEVGYLAHGTMRLGVNIGFDYLSFLWPYLGIQGLLSGYRHSASVSGAEAQGGTGGYEFVGGVHVPILFDKRVSLYGEARYAMIQNENFPIFSNGLFAAAGLGISL